MPIYSPKLNIIAGSNISVTNTTDSSTIAVANVGSANGIASLDVNGKVPVNQLPNSVMEYKGVWSAAINDPYLVDGVGNAGDVYRVGAAGTVNFGNGNISFEIGDYCIYSGSVWQKSDTTDAVTSVNTKTGAVVLDTSDIADTLNKRYVTDAQKTVLTNTSGTNTGDQNVYSSMAVSGQTTLVAATTSDTLTFAGGTNISITTDNATDTITINGGPLLGTYRNKIHNGNFYIASRGTSFVSGANNNDTYNLDRWFVLSNGNDIVDITQSTTAPSYQATSIALDVETINEKFGIAQIVEDIDCKDLIGQTVTLSFQAKVNSLNLNNLKAAVIAWNGTANVVTSDMVSAWNNANVNPTLKSNLSYVNTPTSTATGAFTVANTNWNSYSVTTTVPTTVGGVAVTNLIVFIWSDTKTTSLGDFLYLTEIQLEQASTASPFERLPVSMQQQLCERFLPAFICKGAERYFGGWGAATATSQIMLNYFPFRVPARVPVTGIQISNLAHFRGYGTFPNTTDSLAALAFLVGGVDTGAVIATTTSVAFNSGIVGFLYPATAGTGWLVFTGAEL